VGERGRRERERGGRSGIDIEDLRRIVSYSLCSSCEPFCICDMRNKVSYFAAIQKVASCTTVFSKQMG